MAHEFVGRRDELRLVEHAWHRVASHDERHLVVIEAEPGIGKTALLDEAIRRIGADAPIVHASPTSVEAGISWATLRMFAQRWPAATLPTPVAIATGRQLGEASPPSPADVAFGWAEATRQWSDAQPSVVVLDDAQWCDAASAAAVATAIRTATCLWLVATRPGTHALDVERIMPASELTLITLGGMRRSELADLITTTAGRALAAPTVAQVLDLCGGSPLLAIELARDLSRAPGQPRSRSLAAVYGDRLDTLSPLANELVALAALSFDPSIELLGRLRPDTDLDAALAEAERSALIWLDRRRVRFTHALARHAVVTRLGQLELARLHRILADHVDDPEQTAFHLGLATVRPDSAVAASLEHAAELARRRGASTDAADRYLRAVELTPDDEPQRRRARQIRAASAATDAGDYERGEQLVSELLADPSLLGLDELIELAPTAIVTADRTQGKRPAEQRARSMIDLLAERPRARSATWRTLVRIHQFDDLRLAEQTGEEAVADARASGEPADLLAAEAALANVRYLRGDPIDIDGLAARIAATPSAIAGQSASSFLQELATWDDRFEMGRALIDAFESECRRRGDVTNLANILSQSSFLEFRAGDVSLADKLANEVCEMLYPAPGADLFTTAETMLWIAGTRGDGHQVAHLITTTLAELDQLPAVIHVPFFAYAGYAELALGRHEQAVDHLRAAADAADAIGMGDARGLGWQADLAEAQLLTGDLAGAEHSVERLRLAAERSGSSVVEVDHLRSLGLLQLAGGETAAATETLGRAGDRAPATRRPLVIARTLLAHGSALRRLGNRSQARLVLDAARREFSQLEATPWIERVDDELGRLGARPPAEQVGRLTPAERQIAQLVALGRSNREIASEMIVSLRTVESNLTRVYRKLGVRSRTELAAGGRALLGPS